jgi:hypothetical protein
LQCVAKSDCLKPAIMRCDKIEAHRILSATNKGRGVKRTRSARAVRSSRETGTKGSAPNKRPLNPRHSATGHAPGSNRGSRTEPASRRSRSMSGREFVSAHPSRLNACPEFDRDPVPRSQC